jgi:hypothetical protein
MSEKLHRHGDDVDLGYSRPISPSTSPGKSTLSAKLFRRATRDDNGVAAGAEEHVERAAASSGASLPGDLRERFESSLGADLSGVRVHTGADSQTAASAVGAKAYTVGNDIHFGAGKYDPSSQEGLLLIAHEVAHTVQQAGTTPTRQRKLEVSNEGDAAEVEADRAAEAMVAGAPVAIGASAGLSRSVVSRDGDEDAKASEKDAEPTAEGPDADAIAWAEETRAALEVLQGDIASAQTAINAEATTSVTALKAAQKAFTEFETKYDEAAARFDAAIKKAKQAAEDKAAAFKIIAGAALGLAAPKAALTAIETVSTVAGHVASAGQLAGIAGIIPKPAEKADSGGAGPAKVDWKGLVATTLSTFEKFVADTKTLTEMDQKVDGYIKFLGTVIEGKYKGSDPKADATGAAADEMADNAATIGSDLTEVEIAQPSLEATEFSNGVVNSLANVTGHKIEQDIAIKWISTLQNDVVNPDGTMSHGNLDDIDVVDDYLKKLGVIDVKNSRLGYDTGTITTDPDQKIIWVAAQIEQEAMALVGQTVTWNRGMITAGTGSVWRASGPESLTDREGVQVTVVGYHNPGVRSTWGENKHPSESDMRSSLRYDFTIKVSGPAGG